MQVAPIAGLLNPSDLATKMLGRQRMEGLMFLTGMVDEKDQHRGHEALKPTRKS